MNIVGFFFTKVHGHKLDSFKKGTNKATNIDIINIQKDEAPFDTKNAIIKISFKYEVLYTNPDAKKEAPAGEVSLEGTLSLLLKEEESKDLLKHWKKKEVSANVKQALFNFILRKCSTKALDMEDTINLPFHIPIPQIKLNIKPKN